MFYKSKASKMFILGMLKSMDINNNFKIPTYDYNFELTKIENEDLMKKNFKIFGLGMVFSFFFICFFITLSAYLASLKVNDIYIYISFFVGYSVLIFNVFNLYYVSNNYKYFYPNKRDSKE